jgi:hypothetical protein
VSGFVDKLTGFLGGGLVESVSGVADRFIQTDDEKAAFKVEMEKVLQQRDSEIEQTSRKELSAKASIIVAEMNQGDNYTKRARPTVVYFGLAVIFFNYCFVPLIQVISEEVIAPFALPTEFWLAWGGTVNVYSVGRSMEKRGSRNKFTQAVVGDKPLSLLD